MTTLTLGSLFAGIGGFDEGFRRAGIETRWMVEWDKHCQRVLRHHFPGVPIHGDITTVDPAELRSVDIITFGSPCQDLSVAGKRAGLDVERSGLFHEACRIIAAVRPAIAVWENVPGAFSSNGGKDFGAVLDALGDIGALDIGWRVLDSQFFGVAQRRRRVFVVADFGGQRAGEILALSESLSGHPAPRRTTGQDIAGPLSTGASSDGRHRQDLDGTTYVPLQNATRGLAQNGLGIGGDTMFTLDSLGNHAVAATVSSKWAKGTGGPSGDEVLHLVAVDLAQVTSPGNYSNPQPGDPCHPLTSAANQSVVAFQLTGDRDDAGVSVYDDTHPTLAANPMSDRVPAVATTTVRRLTPRECERLQGFPDVRKSVTIHPCLNCTDHPKTSVVADSQSPRWLRHASHVGVSVLTEYVPFAERHTALRLPSDNRPVALNVHIDSERNEVELLSHGKLIWSASGADSQNLYRLSMPVEDCVRLAVRTISTAEQTIQAGKAASRSGIEPSTLLPSGVLCVPLYGRENGEHANAVDVNTTARNHRSMFTISPVTTSFPTSDSTLATLLCSVVSAIDSCIPDETQDESSFGLSISTSCGWTDVDGMSDSARYRMLGNAVTVNVAEWIAQNITEALR